MTRYTELKKVGKHRMDFPMMSELDLLRSMKQAKKKAISDRERVMHALKFILVVRVTPVFTDDEKQSLIDLIEQWLKNVVPAYAESLLENEDPEEEE